MSASGTCLIVSPMGWDIILKTEVTKHPPRRRTRCFGTLYANAIAKGLFTHTDTEPVTDKQKFWVAWLPMRVLIFTKIQAEIQDEWIPFCPSTIDTMSKLIGPNFGVSVRTCRQALKEFTCNVTFWNVEIKGLEVEDVVIDQTMLSLDRERLQFQNHLHNTEHQPRLELLNFTLLDGKLQQHPKFAT